MKRVLMFASVLCGFSGCPVGRTIDPPSAKETSLNECQDEVDNDDNGWIDCWDEGCCDWGVCYDQPLCAFLRTQGDSFEQGFFADTTTQFDTLSQIDTSVAVKDAAENVASDDATPDALPDSSDTETTTIAALLDSYNTEIVEVTPTVLSSDIFEVETHDVDTATLWLPDIIIGPSTDVLKEVVVPILADTGGSDAHSIDVPPVSLLDVSAVVDDSDAIKVETKAEIAVADVGADVEVEIETSTPPLPIDIGTDEIAMVEAITFLDTTTDDNADIAADVVDATGDYEVNDVDMNADEVSAQSPCVTNVFLCDDSNLCTDDWCDSEIGCQHANNNAPCNDGDSCTQGDTCVAGNCANGAPLVCDDDDTCTLDSCESGVGCVYEWWCECVAAWECDDGNDCTDDVCATGTCQYLPNFTFCDDADACTTNDQCSNNACLGIVIACDDGNECTTDVCDTVTGCQYLPQTGMVCDDNNLCTIADSCKIGNCLGEVVVCDDFNPCTDDNCAPDSGCIFTSNILPCSDNNACTAGDVCQNKTCQSGASLVCDDGNICTTDQCVNGACTTTPVVGCCLIDAECGDNNACTDDLCVNNICVYEDIVCDDSNLCTTNTCDPQSGCTFAFVACNDDDPCTTDYCDSLQGCQAAFDEEACPSDIIIGGGSECENTGDVVAILPCIGKTTIANGPCGTWMHKPGKPGQYAYDVICEESSTVIATKAGKVIDKRNDIDDNCTYIDKCVTGVCPDWCCPKQNCVCPLTASTCKVGNKAIADVSKCACNSKAVKVAQGYCPADCSATDFGNRVLLKADDGTGNYLYPHGEKGSVKVNIGDETCIGLPLMEMGSTGIATDEHVHYCRTDDTSGAYTSKPLYLKYEKDGQIKIGEPPINTEINSTTQLVTTCCGDGFCSNNEKAKVSCPADCGPICTPQTEVCDAVDDDCDGNISEGTCPPVPANYCKDPTTLRQYTAGPPACTSGVCNYAYTDISCADTDLCTVESCSIDKCVKSALPNDCGTFQCGKSPSDCYSCGSCNAANEICQNGKCIATSCSECKQLVDGACVSKSTGTSCADDGDACTDDYCESGACQHPSKQKNACGGCSTLAGIPGSSCLNCGTWQCSNGNNTVVCNKPSCCAKTDCNAGEDCVQGQCKAGACAKDANEPFDDAWLLDNSPCWDCISNSKACCAGWIGDAWNASTNWQQGPSGTIFPDGDYDYYFVELLDDAGYKTNPNVIVSNATGLVLRVCVFFAYSDGDNVGSYVCDEGVKTTGTGLSWLTDAKGCCKESASSTVEVKMNAFTPDDYGIMLISIKQEGAGLTSSCFPYSLQFTF